ncbi:EAL domain-containing protein [Altererythrobacter sp. CC-YST694]|uniref:sensor domain-containing protein n=1 Tax=Altererythrobacter sp. CC-YST694 TaxID=2755038 RepID=UPI001D01C793|nr:EAL domain-containing protein [Altererythrobacter sp. CC-YST694]MCB5423952.1 EAL domain-containing protein [Altererythrobacter sp. CC-YST694]
MFSDENGHSNGMAILRPPKIENSLRDQAFDELVRLAASICETPMVVLSLLDEDRYWFKARIGVDAGEAPRSWSVCESVLSAGRFYQSSSPGAPTVGHNWSLIDLPAVEFYAGTPLFSADGIAFGAICVMSSSARPSGLSEKQIRGLESLANLATAVMDRRGTELLGDPIANDHAKRGAASDNLIGNLPGTVFRSSLQFPRQISFLSDTVTRLTGYERSEFLTGTASWSGCIEPEDLAVLENAVLEASRKEGAYEVVYRFRKKGGELTWLRESGLVTRDAGTSTLEGYIIDYSKYKNAEAALLTSEARMATVLRNATVGILHRDISGNIILMNEKYAELTGRTAEELDGLHFEEFTHPDDLKATLDSVAECLRTGQPSTVKKRYVHKDGSCRWCEVTISMVKDGDESAATLVAIAKDIDAEIAAEHAIREREERLSLAVDAAQMGIWDIDLHSGKQVWSAKLVDLLGLNKSTEPNLRKFLGRLAEGEMHRLRHRRLQIRRRYGDRDTLRLGFRFKEVFQIIRADTAKARWLSCAGRLVQGDTPQGRLILSFRDITNEIETHEKVRWIANHDNLTGLANRRSFSRVLETRLSDGGRVSGPFALIQIDLDNFKDVNDTNGHEAGDAVLCSVADRIRPLLDPGGLLARLGGDEFGILINSDSEGVAAEHLCRKIVATLGDPVALSDGRVVDVRASMGISLFPEQGRDINTLLRHADLALYAAKRSGKGSFRTFSARMADEMNERSFMIGNARAAIRNESIIPYYQPKHCLRTGRRVGLEALLRWRDEVGVMRSPDCLAAAFDDHEMATKITDIMLGKIADDIQQWTLSGIDYGHVAINATSADLRSGALFERISGALGSRNIPIDAVQVEVTENVLMESRTGKIMKELEKLQGQGITICLDDFGTGFASLAHLRNFPVDVIKIDRSFVSEIRSFNGRYAIVDAIVHMCRALNILTVAEGIETPDQEDYLRSVGCNLGQGFLFGRAQSADEVAKAKLFHVA